MAKQNKPNIIKVGRGVRAKLWRNSNDNGEWFTTEIVRTYKKDDEDLQDTTKYRRDDLLLVAHAALKAYDAILDFEDEPAAPDVG